MLKTKIYIILAILAVSLFEEIYAKGGMGKNSGRLAAGRKGGRGRGGGSGRNRGGYAGGGAGGAYGGGDYKDAPCVGLCFHNKLQALEEKDDDYSRGWPLNSKDFVDQPPCVGLCQMFRELNIPNPFHKYQHTGTKPTPMPTTKSPLSPLT